MAGHEAGRAPASPLDRGIERARQVLPDQGPIGVFVHHKPLHAFLTSSPKRSQSGCERGGCEIEGTQHLPFHRAVVEGSRLLRARPYLPLDEFHRLFESGRIEPKDLETSLARALGDGGAEVLPTGITRAELWRAMMLDGIDEDDAAGLGYLRRRARADVMALVDAAEARLASASPRPNPPRDFARPRDALVALTGNDPDECVHPEMIRLAAVFLDHGQALQRMPRRSEGFLAAVNHLYAAGAPEGRASRGVRDDLRVALASGASVRDIIRSALDALGIPDEDAESFILHTALALPGWTGMFSRLERHPEEHASEGTVSLEEFLAVLLLHDRRATHAATRAAGLPDHWPALRELAARPAPRPPLLDAWLLAGIARRARLAPSDIARLPDSALQVLWHEVDACSRHERQRMWHEAYEDRYRRQVLDGLAALRAERDASAPAGDDSDGPMIAPERPQAQFVFCIDEREESIRRAIEEQPGMHETFGFAGFFGVAIDYKGLYDHHPAAYCPVVVTPQHEVHEGPLYTERGRHATRSEMRARWQAPVPFRASRPPSRSSAGPRWGCQGLRALWPTTCCCTRSGARAPPLPS